VLTQGSRTTEVQEPAAPFDEAQLAAVSFLARRRGEHSRSAATVCTSSRRQPSTTSPCLAAVDAGVPLRDFQMAARHADPRTTTICDRRHQNFDRHVVYRRRLRRRRLKSDSGRTMVA
jgi:hypothetical protein